MKTFQDLKLYHLFVDMRLESQGPYKNDLVTQRFLVVILIFPPLQLPCMRQDYWNTGT